MTEKRRENEKERKMNLKTRKKISIYKKEFKELSRKKKKKRSFVQKKNNMIKHLQT